jgi:hypothetical protein
MGSNTQRFHIALDMSHMNDAEIASTVAGIQKVAPSSALLQDAGIAASYKALGTKATTLTSRIAALAADQAQVKLDETALLTARTDIEGELGSLRGLVVNAATSPADITGMGFVQMIRAGQTRTVPMPPAQLITRLGKVHGRARVTVSGVKTGNFVAESTPDPLVATSVWSSLPGNGRQRTLTGATGSKLWVRFAQVRYGLQSDWSTPVLVTLP